MIAQFKALRPNRSVGLFVTIYVSGLKQMETEIHTCAPSVFFFFFFFFLFQLHFLQGTSQSQREHNCTVNNSRIGTWNVGIPKIATDTATRKKEKEKKKANVRSGHVYTHVV